MLGAPSIPASLWLQSPMASMGFPGSLSLVSMALTCIPYLLHGKIFILKIFEFGAGELWHVFVIRHPVPNAYFCEYVDRLGRVPF